MYHSITFGDKNTYDDWHLVPSSRPLFVPPEVKTNLVEIPGGNGSIDLTTALTGEVTYSNREGSFEFYVLNGYSKWHEKYSELLKYLHGKSMRATLEDDPDYYYEGRFSIDSWDSEKDWSKVTIKYNVFPYKFSWHTPNDRLIWDEVNFDSEILQNLNDLVISGSKEITVYGDELTVNPTFIANVTSGSTFTLTKGSDTYTIPNGTSHVAGFNIYNGENTFTVTGTGTLTMQFRSGKL